MLIQYQLNTIFNPSPLACLSNLKVNVCIRVVSAIHPSLHRKYLCHTVSQILKPMKHITPCFYIMSVSLSYPDITELNWRPTRVRMIKKSGRKPFPYLLEKTELNHHSRRQYSRKL